LPDVKKEYLCDRGNKETNKKGEVQYRKKKKEYTTEQGGKTNRDTKSFALKGGLQRKRGEDQIKSRGG